MTAMARWLPYPMLSIAKAIQLPPYVSIPLLNVLFRVHISLDGARCHAVAMPGAVPSRADASRSSRIV